MDAYLYPMDWVEVGNRTKKPLTIMYNGVPWPLPPYPAVQKIPRIVADKGVQQHPIMGTEDPFNPKSFESLIFVRWKVDGAIQMDETPIEQNTKAVERLDRSLLPAKDQKAEVVTYGRASRPERPDADAGAHFSGDLT